MNPERWMKTASMAALLLAGGALVSAATGTAMPPVADAPAATAPAAGAAVLDAVEPWAIERYREHVLTLANPYFEGRQPGTVGNERAAEYLEFWFRRLDLTPAFPVTTTAADGTEVTTDHAAYRQSFSFRSMPRATQRVLGLRTDAGVEREFTPGADYEVLGFSGSASAEGRVVFVGYGIEEGPEGFTSFPQDGDDLEGKIAMVLRFEPVNEEGRSAFSGRNWTNHAAIESKIAAVASRNPAGIILVSPPGADDARVGRLESTGGTMRMAPRQKVPVMMMTTEAADRLVRAADRSGRSLVELRKLADKGVDGFIELGTATVRMDAAVERVPHYTDNVAAVLPGKGSLAGQYVVVGAHFDHVGDGTLGGSRSNEVGVIHYGADDNASGTAGMLLSAELLKQAYDDLPADAEARSILFIGFSAEELGLIGSRYFVQNSHFSAAAIYAMLNMDMIGRLREDRLEVFGVGTAEGFEDFLEPLFQASGLTIARQRSGRGPSDHASFYAAGVPVLHFFTGYHPEYHTPRDVAMLINAEGGTQVSMLNSRIALALAQRGESLVFQSTDGGGRAARRQAPADPHAGGEQGQTPAASTGSVSGVRVRFGIAPGNYDESEVGVVVGDVFPGTSAAVGGIQRGDRMIRWNDQDLDNVEGWMVFLAAANPGDVVDIVVVRDGAEVPLKVTLQARDTGQR